MFNISSLQYIVFLVIALPPFAIGFFKGWKAAAFTLLATVVSGAVIIIVSSIIYEHTLWPIFRNMFVARKVGSGLDSDALMSFSKVTVISVVVGITILPMLGIISAIYFLLRKRLRKDMMPTVSVIDSNTKNISRRNLLISRLTGVALNGTAGIIIASAASTAVATLATTSSHNNFFTKTTRAFAHGYTFGQGQYDSNYQNMYEFLEYTNEFENVDAMENIFSMSLTNAPTSVEISKVSTGEFHDAMGKLFEHSKSSAALITLMTSKIVSRKIDLIPGATTSSSSRADIGIEDIETAFATRLNFNLSRNVASKTVDDMFKRLIPFKKSEFYKNWVTAKELIVSSNEKWSDLRNEFILLSQKKVATEKDIARIFSRINKLTEEKRILDLNADDKRSVKYQEDLEGRRRGPYDAQFAIANGFKTTLTNAEENLRIENSTLTSRIGTLEDETRKLGLLKNNKLGLKKRVRDIVGKISDRRNTISLKEGNKSGLNSKVVSANVAYNDANSKLIAARNYFDSLKNSSDQLELNKSRNAVNSAAVTATETKNAANVAQNAVTDNNNNIANNERAITELNSEIGILNNRIIALKGDIMTTNPRISSLKSEIEFLKSNTIPDLRVDVENARIDWKPANEKMVNLRNIWKTEKDKLVGIIGERESVVKELAVSNTNLNSKHNINVNTVKRIRILSKDSLQRSSNYKYADGYISGPAAPKNVDDKNSDLNGNHINDKGLIGRAYEIWRKAVNGEDVTVKLKDLELRNYIFRKDRLKNIYINALMH